MRILPVVSINEAVEVAKRYSTADAGRFVNGILDKIRKIIEPPDTVKPNQESPDQADDTNTDTE